jgi:hypothetical protein
MQLGGNHDYWHVVRTGKDGLRMLCDRREDMVYLGYDACGVPVTDKAHVRLVHPSGGTAYAKSYRLQKFQESQAIEALQEAIREEESPIITMIVMGHLHQAIYLPTMPMIGLMPGGFEGQTNYLKRKGLVPDIGGTVLKLHVDDSGKVKIVTHIWMPFLETKDDWKEWPLPDVMELDFEPDEFDVLFSVEDLNEEGD